MAGIVYMKSNSKVSLTGPEYTDISIPSGCKTLYIQTGNATSDRLKYGLTTDTTASEYSPAINVSGRTMYIASQGTALSGKTTITATSIDSYGYKIKEASFTSTFRSTAVYRTYYRYTSGTIGSKTLMVTVASGSSQATQFSLKQADTITYTCTSVKYQNGTQLTAYSGTNTYSSTKQFPYFKGSTSVKSRTGNYILATSVSNYTDQEGTFTYYMPSYYSMAPNSSYVNLYFLRYKHEVNASLAGKTYTFATEFTTNIREQLTSESTYTSSYDVTITTNNIYTGN